MMYQNKLVACIKTNGKILREIGDQVTIPFGSEYSILIKNLNSVRIKFKLSIDGQDATSDTWIVVSPNSQIEMERFITNGNWSCGNRFKFIERTSEIEAYRGIRSDDGIVRIEYQTEVVTIEETIIRRHYEDDYCPYPLPPRRKPASRTSAPSRRDMGSVSLDWCDGDRNSSRMSTSVSAPINDTGITVAGSVSHQQFHSAEWFQTSQSQVLILRLRGEIGGIAVERPLTVKDKIMCKTCGTTSMPTLSFCGKCGTALQLV